MIIRFRVDEGGTAIYVRSRLHIPRRYMSFPPDHEPYSQEMSHGFMNPPPIARSTRFGEGLTADMYHSILHAVLPPRLPSMIPAGQAPSMLLRQIKLKDLNFQRDLDWLDRRSGDPDVPTVHPRMRSWGDARRHPHRLHPPSRQSERPSSCERIGLQWTFLSGRIVPGAGERFGTRLAFVAQPRGDPCRVGQRLVA